MTCSWCLHSMTILFIVLGTLCLVWIRCVPVSTQGQDWETHTHRWKRLDKSCVILALSSIILYSKNLNLKMIIDDVSLSLSLWCSGRAFLWYLKLNMDLVQPEIPTAGTAAVHSSTALTGLWEQHSTPFTLSGLCTGGWGLNDGGEFLGPKSQAYFCILTLPDASIKSSKYFIF